MGAFLPCLSLILALFITGCQQQAPKTATGTGTAATAVKKATATSTRTGRATATPENLTPEQRARKIFSEMLCVDCHTIKAYPEAAGTVGPDLNTIFTQAATIIASPEYKASAGKATTPREYLKESILTPGAYLFPTCPLNKCPADIMPVDFSTRITPEDLEILLDMLATLK